MVVANPKELVWNKTGTLNLLLYKKNVCSKVNSYVLHTHMSIKAFTQSLCLSQGLTAVKQFLEKKFIDRICWHIFLTFLTQDFGFRMCN